MKKLATVALSLAVVASPGAFAQSRTRAKVYQGTQFDLRDSPIHGAHNAGNHEAATCLHVRAVSSRQKDFIAHSPGCLGLRRVRGADGRGVYAPAPGQQL